MLGASTPISPGQGNTLGGRALPSSSGSPCPTGMHAAHFSGSRKGLGCSCSAENQTPPMPHILLSWGCPKKPAQAEGLKQKLMLSRLWRPGVQNKSASRAVSFQSPGGAPIPGSPGGCQQFLCPGLQTHHSSLCSAFSLLCVRHPLL